MIFLVGDEGIEPSASRSRTERSTDELVSELWRAGRTERSTDELHPV